MNLYRHKLRRTADQAADFLEFTFFLRTEMMAGVGLQVELRVRVAKLVICLGQKEMKIVVEFIPDLATWMLRAFQYR